MPNPEDILSIDSENVAEFIQEQAAAKTLSALIHRLNELLIAGDAASSRLAALALNHLGFPEYA